MKIKESAVLVLAGIFLILNIQNINAGIGLSPATRTFGFVPNQSYQINYQVLNVDADQEIAVSASGDLSDYVKFDKRNFTGPQSFIAYIDLPSRLEKYGSNILYIVVREVVRENGGFSTVLSVGARVYINVQYPGKYAEIQTFTASDTNENESLYFYLELYNRGTEDLEPNAYFEVYSKGKFLDKYTIGSKVVASNSIGIFDKTIDMNKYKAGDYMAKAYVTLNDINKTLLTANNTFRVGNLFVNITNWSREAIKGKINPFNIEIESKWNHDLKNVYAQVNVTNETGSQVDFFKTSPYDLIKWDKAILNGYFNAENLDIGNFRANITLFYEDTISSKAVDVKVIIPEVPKKEGKVFNYLLIIGIIAAIVIIFIIALVIILLKKKNGKKLKIRK